jgi:hypothetical protein
MAEALGITLPGNAAFPAADARRNRLAQLSGRRIVAMVAEDLRPSAVLTRQAFENAIRTLAAIGGTEGGPYERLALLKAAYFRADTLTLPELEATLGTLATEDTAMGALSRELIAAKAYASGDIARARTEYNRLKFDAAAPAGVVQRAEIALAAIPVAADETAPAAPTETPAEETPETGQ